MSNEHIFTEIKKEREYQLTKYGTDDDDNRNSPNAWVMYITNYATRWFPGGFPPYNSATIQDFRENMIKVATLAVAAIEWVDRLEPNGSNYRPDIIKSDYVSISEPDLEEYHGNT